MDHWSDLPQDIVEFILKKVDTPTDILNFSAVCKRWRSVSMEYMHHHHTNIPIFHFLPKLCPLPMLLVPSATDGQEMYKLYSVNEQRTYNGVHIPELKNKWICGSSRGWLVTVDKMDKQMHLINPFFRKQVLLPNMSTFRMPIRPEYHHEMNYCYSVMKANIIFGASGRVEDCVVVAFITTKRRICFCRIEDDKWTDVYKSPLSARDIIAYDDLLYYIDYGGALLSIDIRMQKECCGIASRFMVTDSNVRYLVESPIGLLMVVRCSTQHGILYNETIRFRVFQLTKRRSRGIQYELENEFIYNREYLVTHEWVEMESIGDWLIFVGYNYSLCLDSRLYPSSKGNCIYFADDVMDFDGERFCSECPNTPHDIGVYHFQEKRVEYLNGLCNFANHHAIWLSPSM